MSAAIETEELPKWEVGNIYPGFDSPEYQSDLRKFSAGLDELERLYDEFGVRRLAEAPASADAQLAERLEQALERNNALLLLEDQLGSFTHALLTTDSYDPAALRETSRLEILSTRRQKLDVRLKAWIGSLTPGLEALASLRPLLAEHRFFLLDTAHQSRYLMPEDQENLAAELCLDAGAAWGKLQGSVTSQLKAKIEGDGGAEELPVTVVRNMSYDPDPAVRERAYHAEQHAWHSIRTTVAACFNGVKGTAITLAKRRGRESVLQASLDSNRIDQPTLEALLGAIRESFPLFRRYLQSKARKLGRKNLPWWDLFAPLGAADRRFSWAEAREFIIGKFSTFSDELGSYAARAFDERWIDALPRDGKRGGAYCMGVMAREESRILANFDGSFEQVMTLAHELGHGFHNHCQAGLPPLRRGAPSTLAETASIFCETLVTEAALAEASPDEQLTILETQLMNATQVCMDISSRFLFESSFLARRAQCELAADEISELMLTAQRETYGDGVDAETYHRYMWLWKPHYYAYEHNFYNFPYAFGLLFGLGLYAVYQQAGEAFVPRYSELLRGTGQEYAAPLAARFGADIRSIDFWRQSLRIVEDQVRRYESLAPSSNARA